MITGCKVSQIVLDETNFLLGVQQRVYSSGVSKAKDSICQYHCGIFQIILESLKTQINFRKKIFYQQITFILR